MKTRKHNILFLVAALMLFSLNLTPVLAQQMLIQVLGGGYRLNGPTTLAFSPVEASFTEATSDLSIRDVTTGYVEVEDQNGGNEFSVQIAAYTDLTDTTYGTYTIGRSNFLVKNRSGTGNDVDTINGREDGLTLEPTLNDFYQDPPTNSIPNDLVSPRNLASGTGQKPGTWRFYPGFRIIIPGGQAIGTYETTLYFTIY